MRSIFYHADVFTGNSGFAEAFLIEDGTISAVGSDQEILALADPDTACIDLKGSFVCSGFNDSHMHLLAFGKSLLEAQLSSHTGSLREMLACLRAYADTHPPKPGQWLLGRGWNQDYFSDVSRMPDRYDLDTISTEYPIMVTRACGHCCVVNSRALALAGISAETAPPEGGAIGIENGTPDGRFYDNAMNLLTPLVPLPDKEDLKEMIRRACTALNAYGITSVQSDDYCVFRELPFETINDAFRELEKNGELTVRIYEQANFTELSELKRFVEAGNRTGTGSDFFKIGPLKLLGDGSLGSRTAHLSRPYEDAPETCGFSLFSQKELQEMISFAHKHGMQIAVHAIGDACLDQVLSAFEQALREYPRKDHRHGIVHCQITRPDQLQKIRALELHVYAQSIFLDYDSHIVEKRVGTVLSGTSYAWKTLLHNGVTVSNGSDCPVELPDCMRGIECAVTRTSLDGTGPYRPEEAFSVQEALNSFTAAGAYASFEENRKGRIVPGYAADFTVLGENPFLVPQDTLHRIPVLACFSGGICVTDSGLQHCQV